MCQRYHSPDFNVPTDPSRKRRRDDGTAAPEDLVGPGQVEEVVHLFLALGQVDAQTVLCLRRRRVRVLHSSLQLHITVPNQI